MCYLCSQINITMVEYIYLITHIRTKHRYRFNIEDEFVERFGHNWINIITCGWHPDMDTYFGKDVNISEIDEGYLSNYHTISYNSQWSVSMDMLIENILLDYKSIYGSKKLCYE